jgi:Tol biopolymer transport system component
MPRAGGASRTLVPGPSMNSEPSFSPDGKQVAFISNRGGSGDTWVIDTAGGSPRQLTSWADEETDAEWSADSKSLYVMSVNGGGAFYDVYRVSRDGGAPEQLTKTANIQNIEPSRGNNALYVTAFGSKPGQVILGQLMPNGTMKTLWDKSNVTGLSHHRISPSGDSLAVQIEKAGGNFASVILSASSGTVTPILQRGDIAGAWSPDGTRIVYYSGTPSADLGILTLKDGTTKPLTKTAANEGNAMWTPDSKSIVVQRSAPRRRIAVVDVSALVSAQQTGSSKR